MGWLWSWGRENIDEPGTSCEAQTEVLNEGTCQKGTEVNLMGSPWPNKGQRSIKMMIGKDYNPQRQIYINKSGEKRKLSIEFQLIKEKRMMEVKSHHLANITIVAGKNQHQ